MSSHSKCVGDLEFQGAVYLKNEHGVVIKLIATDVGLRFDLSADGVHVSLKN